jgi:broad specificity phosphatase PhoE
MSARAAPAASRAARLVGAILVCGALGGAARADEACAAATVYVLRHAEKAPAGDDPDVLLAPAGQRRAEALAQHLAAEPIEAIYATHLRRTQHTVAALAAALDREIRVLPADDGARLLRRLRQGHCGRTVLVVGHSNTVPEILRGLGVAEPPTIADDDYGTLWLVRPGTGGVASIEEQRFGDTP